MNARELLVKATPRPWEALDVDPGAYPWIGRTDDDGQIQGIFETDDRTNIDRANVLLVVQSVNEREALLDIEEASADLIEVVIAQDKALRDGFWNTNHRVAVAASCMRLEAARVRLDAIRAAGGKA